MALTITKVATSSQTSAGTVHSIALPSTVVANPNTAVIIAIQQVYSGGNALAAPTISANTSGLTTLAQYDTLLAGGSGNGTTNRNTVFVTSAAVATTESGSNSVTFTTSGSGYTWSEVAVYYCTSADSTVPLMSVYKNAQSAADNASTAKSFAFPVLAHSANDRSLAFIIATLSSGSNSTVTAYNNPVSATVIDQASFSSGVFGAAATVVSTANYHTPVAGMYVTNASSTATYSSSLSVMVRSASPGFGVMSIADTNARAFASSGSPNSVAFKPALISTYSGVPAGGYIMVEVAQASSSTSIAPAVPTVSLSGYTWTMVGTSVTASGSLSGTLVRNSVFLSNMVSSDVSATTLSSGSNITVSSTSISADHTLVAQTTAVGGARAGTPLRQYSVTAAESASNGTQALSAFADTTTQNTADTFYASQTWGSSIVGGAGSVQNNTVSYSTSTPTVAFTTAAVQTGTPSSTSLYSNSTPYTTLTNGYNNAAYVPSQTLTTGASTSQATARAAMFMEFASLRSPAVVQSAETVVVSDDAGPNLITNPSLETGSTSPWAPANGTLSTTTAWKNSGTYSLALTKSSGTPDEGVYSNYVPILVGAAYTASAVLYSPAVSVTASLLVEWFDSSYAYMSYNGTAGQATTVGVPLTLSISATAPAGAVYGEVFIYYGGTIAAGVVQYIDDVSMTRNGAAMSITVQPPTSADSLAIAEGASTLTNLLPNSSFETDTSNWQTSRVLGRTTAWSSVGSYALTVTNNSGATNDATAYANQVAISPGLPYVAHFVTYAPSAATTGIPLINWYDSSSTFISQSGPSAYPIPLTTPTTIRVGATAPANAAYAQAGIYFPSLTAGQVVYIDDARLITSSIAIANPSFETDTSTWNGVFVTLGRTTAWASIGTYSMTVTKSNSGTPDASVYENNISLLPATAYGLSAVIYSPTVSTSVYTVLNWYNSSGTYLGQSLSGPFTTQVGQPVVVSTSGQMSPPTAAYGQIGLYFPSMSTGDVHYVDNFSFTRSNITSTNVTPVAALISSGFESSLTGWASYGSSISQSAAWANSGTYSAKAVSTAGGFAGLVTGYIPIVGGSVYNAAFTAKADAANASSSPNFIMYAYFYVTQGGSHTTQSFSGTGNKTAGSKFAGSYTAPSDANYVVLYMLATGSTTGDAYYFDDVSMAPTTLQESTKISDSDLLTINQNLGSESINAADTMVFAGPPTLVPLGNEAADVADVVNVDKSRLVVTEPGDQSNVADALLTTDYAPPMADQADISDNAKPTIGIGGLLNLVPNPGFEADASGWSGFGATLTQSNDWANTGTYSGKVSSPFPNQYSGILSDYIPVTPGTTYRLRYKAKSDPANLSRTLYAGINGYNYAGATPTDLTPAGVNTLQINPGNTGTASFDFTPTAGLYYVRISLLMFTTTTSDVMYFDDVEVYTFATHERVVVSDAVSTTANIPVADAYVLLDDVTIDKRRLVLSTISDSASTMEYFNVTINKTRDISTGIDPVAGYQDFAVLQDSDLLLTAPVDADHPYGGLIKNFLDPDVASVVELFRIGVTVLSSNENINVGQDTMTPPNATMYGPNFQELVRVDETFRIYDASRGTSTTDEWWSIDNVSLHQTSWNITTLGGSRFGVPAMRGEDIQMSNRPGRIWVPKIPDSRVITLIMWMAAIDPDTGRPPNYQQSVQWNDNWNYLRKLFYSPKKQRVLTRRWKLNHNNPRIDKASAKVQLGGTMDPNMTGRTRAEFSVDLVLADPYFYGNQIYETVTVTTNPVTPNIRVINNPGDDTSGFTNLSVTFFGPLSNPRLVNKSGANGDLWFKLNTSNVGTIAAGDSVTFNVEVFKATRTSTGAVVTAAVTHSGAIPWFALEPGDNVCVLEADAPSTGYALISYKPAYV